MSDSFATPWTIARQAPLSKGFPREEYWSGLPHPYTGDLPNLGINLCFLHWQADSSPLSEPLRKPQYIYNEVKVTQSCPTLWDPMDYTVHGFLQSRILEWVTIPFSRGSSQPEVEPRSPTLQADSLPPEPAGKPNMYSAQCKMMKY